MTLWHWFLIGLIGGIVVGELTVRYYRRCEARDTCDGTSTAGVENTQEPWTTKFHAQAHDLRTCILTLPMGYCNSVRDAYLTHTPILLDNVPYICTRITQVGSPSGMYTHFHLTEVADRALV